MLPSFPFSLPRWVAASKATSRSLPFSSLLFSPFFSPLPKTVNAEVCKHKQDYYDRFDRLFPFSFSPPPFPLSAVRMENAGIIIEVGFVEMLRDGHRVMLPFLLFPRPPRQTNQQDPLRKTSRPPRDSCPFFPLSPIGLTSKRNERDFLEYEFRGPLFFFFSFSSLFPFFSIRTDIYRSQQNRSQRCVTGCLLSSLFPFSFSRADPA